MSSPGFPVVPNLLPDVTIKGGSDQGIEKYCQVDIL
ncbi:unnamed protein product, partial [marine sediment metagenome]